MNKENHYALWNWLMENPNKEKADWPGFQTMKQLRKQRPPAYCFLCEEFPSACTNQEGKCPLYPCCGSLSKKKAGPYQKWLDSEGNKRVRIATAKKIRDCWR
jgi:hypothetical protein